MIPSDRLHGSKNLADMLSSQLKVFRRGWLASIVSRWGEHSAFGGELPTTLEIVWSARLLTTAGRSINSWCVGLH